MSSARSNYKPRLREFMGKQIYNLRTKMSLNEKDFAKKVGISVSYVYVLEKGGSNPSYNTISGIADACGVDFAYFFPPKINQPKEATESA